MPAGARCGTRVRSTVAAGRLRRTGLDVASRRDDRRRARADRGRRDVRSRERRTRRSGRGARPRRSGAAWAAGGDRTHAVRRRSVEWPRSDVAIGAPAVPPRRRGGVRRARRDRAHARRSGGDRPAARDARTPAREGWPASPRPGRSPDPFSMSTGRRSSGMPRRGGSRGSRIRATRASTSCGTACDTSCSPRCAARTRRSTRRFWRSASAPLAGEPISKRSSTSRCAIGVAGEHTLVVAASELAGYDRNSLRVLWGALAGRVGLALDRRGTTRCAAFTMKSPRRGVIPLSGGWRLEAVRDELVLHRVAPTAAGESMLPDVGALSVGQVSILGGGPSRG